MKVSVLVLMLFLMGCEGSVEIQRSQDNLCVSKDSKKELASFIISCAKAANPLSDEEGEDLVKQCEWTGQRTICPLVDSCRKVTRSGGIIGSTRYGEWGPCDS